MPIVQSPTVGCVELLIKQRWYNNRHAGQWRYPRWERNNWPMGWPYVYKAIEAVCGNGRGWMWHLPM